MSIQAVSYTHLDVYKRQGIILGIVFGKLMYLVLGKLLHYDISVKVTVEIPVLEKTFVFFMAIFVLILLYNLLQIRIVSPVELLHGSNQGAVSYTHLDVYKRQIIILWIRMLQKKHLSMSMMEQTKD